MLKSMINSSHLEEFYNACVFCFSLNVVYVPMRSTHSVVWYQQCMYLHLFSFIFPASITKVISSIVMEVSAMLVAMTIFVTPSGGFLKLKMSSRIKYGSDQMSTNKE